MTDLPTGWEVRDVASVAELVRGVTYSKSDVRDSESDDSVPLLRATNIGDGQLTFSDPVLLPQSTVKPLQYLRDGDIVVASSSGSTSVVGKSALVRNGPSATFGAFCTVIRAHAIDPQYLAYYVQSPVVRQSWSDAARGTNINNLKPGTIGGTHVPVPSRDEQRRIVEILDDHLSGLEAARVTTDNQSRRLSSLRTSLLNSAFLDCPGALETLGDKFPCAYGKADDKTLRSPEGAFPVVGSGGVMTYTTAPLVTGSAVLIGRKGNVGSVQLVDGGCHPIDTVYWIEVPPSTIPKFLAYQLEGLQLDRLDSSTAVPSLRRQDLESVQLKLPSSEVQIQVVENIEAALTSCSRLSTAVANLSQRFDSLRRSLLQAAFTGQLTKEFRDE